MMRWALIVQTMVFLLCLFPFPQGVSVAAEVTQTSDTKSRAALRVWDTGQSAAEPLAASVLANQDGWIPIPTQMTAASFQGDAVMTNGRILAVQRRQSPVMEVYSVGATGALARLRLLLLRAAGDPASQLDRMALVENSKGAACVAVSFRTG